MSLPTGGRRLRRGAITLAVLAAVVAGGTLLPAIARADDVSPSPTTSPTDNPSPTDSPTPSDSPSPTDSPTTDPSDSSSPSVSDGPSDSPTGDPTPSSTTPTPTGRPTSPSSHGGPVTGPPDGGQLPPFLLPSPKQRKLAHGNKRLQWKGWTPSTSWGTYSTALLDSIAKRMRAHGVKEAKILRTVYAPFIVEGPATWSDSWHAPRYTGGFHLHEGQDVLCRWGAPVLAAVQGRLTFGWNSLGGLAAYIALPQGGFLYYAHLSKEMKDLSGSTVHPGDVIGRCGATGDATVPHVHFSWYDAHDVAHDPMKLLVGWLHKAERRVVGRISKANKTSWLRPGLQLEAPPHLMPSTAPSEVVVQQAAAVIPVTPSGGGPGPWALLALLVALLLPAAAIRRPQVRAKLAAFLSADDTPTGDDPREPGPGPEAKH